MSLSARFIEYRAAEELESMYRAQMANHIKTTTLAYYQAVAKYSAQKTLCDNLANAFAADLVALETLAASED